MVCFRIYVDENFAFKISSKIFNIWIYLQKWRYIVVMYLLWGSESRDCGLGAWKSCIQHEHPIYYIYIMNIIKLAPTLFRFPQHLEQI